MAESSILRINEKSIRVQCQCGESFNHKTDDFKPKFVKEFGQFENLMAGPCPACQSIIGFNMNLPITEFDENEMEEEAYFPDGEKGNRDKVRQLMWKHRNDLNENKRADQEKKEQERLEYRFGLPVHEIRGVMKRSRRLTITGTAEEFYD